MWSGASPGEYNKAADAESNAAIAEVHDSLCRPN
jgi:hypothetical protein